MSGMLTLIFPLMYEVPQACLLWTMRIGPDKLVIVYETQSATVYVANKFLMHPFAFFYFYSKVKLKL